MRTKKKNPNTDEIIAFVLFIICIIISFFRHPAVTELPFTGIN